MAFLVAASSAGAAMAEAALRWHYPTLPSVAGLEGSDFRLETLVDAADDGGDLCRESATFLSHRSRWGGPAAGPGGTEGIGPPPGPMRPPLAGPDGPPLPGAPPPPRERRAGVGPARHSLWFVGDSVTYGLGVGPAETFGALLTEKFAGELGAPVTSENLGVPGAGFCGALRRLATALATKQPDRVFITFYADDLEEATALTVQGRLVMPPELARSAGARWLVGRSYLANAVWYAFRRSEVPSNPNGRRLNEGAVAEFQAAATTMRDRVVAAGGSTTFVLLPAPSERSCTTSDPGARCRFLADDLAAMAGALTEAGILFIDLRGSWPEGVQHIRADERRAIEGGGVAMHPNAEGHRLLADAIWTRLHQVGMR